VATHGGPVPKQNNNSNNDKDHNNNNTTNESSKDASSQPKDIPEPSKHSNRVSSCERIEYSDLEKMGYSNAVSAFINEYVMKGRPVVISNATSHWRAHTRWTNDFFRRSLGSKHVTLYVSSRDGWFEGCEDVSQWPCVGKGAKLPPHVEAALDDPNTVVVRPATVPMPMHKFLDLLSSSNRTASFYLEYTSLPHNFPEILLDFDEPIFSNDKAGTPALTLDSRNIWFGDGHTLGKLHFDPFDNLMCLVAGKKQFVLFDPLDNQDLYEGHIREAFLDYNSTTQKLSRDHLGDSTSMVMSPVDIARPNLEKHPLFKNKSGGYILPENN